jgi:hypothetical protein
MPKINKIAGIDPKTVIAFRRQKIHTLEDLWVEMGPDWYQKGADYEAGLANVAQKTGLDRQKIQEVLARGAHDPTVRPHASEIALLAGLLVLLGLLAWRWIASVVSMPSPVLVAGQNLPAFHVLVESDLASAAKGAQAGSFTQPAQVSGRYLLRPLAMGEVITEDLVSSKRLDPSALAGQYVLTIPIPAGGLDSSLEPGDPAWLILSPRDLPESVTAGAVEAPALLLKLEKSGDLTLATLAIPIDRHAAIVNALGLSQVILQHRGP